MADRQLDDRTIACDSYAIFGTLDTLPERPEPPRPTTVRITYSELVSRYFKSEDVYAIAKRHGFPSAAGRVPTQNGLGESFWLMDAVQAWAETQRADLPVLNAVLRTIK